MNSHLTAANLRQAMILLEQRVTLQAKLTALEARLGGLLADGGGERLAAVKGKATSRPRRKPGGGGRPRTRPPVGGAATPPAITETSVTTKSATGKVKRVPRQPASARKVKLSPRPAAES